MDPVKLVTVKQLSRKALPFVHLPRLLLCCCFLLTGIARLQAEENPKVADRILRFVNDTVITQGEVFEEMRDRFIQLRSQGKTLPDSEEALQELRQQALETLTENLLLNQEADRLEIQLDITALRREIRTWIRDNNMSPSVIHEANEVKRRRLAMRARFVLNHYQDQWQPITPSDIQQYYQENKPQFTKPQQAQASRILLRPSGKMDVTVYQRELMTLIQRVQIDETPAVAQSISDEQLSTIVRTPETERSDILRETLAQVLATVPENAPARTMQLAETIRASLSKWDGFKTEAQVKEQLNTIRQQILQLGTTKERLQLFAEQAKQISQGPNADQGGDLGLNEIGKLDQSVEERLYTMQVGELSTPFKLGEFWCLLLAAYRDDSQARSLREVAPEIRAFLEEQRVAAVRSSLVEQLRSQGIVRDLDVVPELPAEWFEDQPVQASKP